MEFCAAQRYIYPANHRQRICRLLPVWAVDTLVNVPQESDTLVFDSVQHRSLHLRRLQWASVLSMSPK
jgi:hypothetical protein